MIKSTFKKRLEEQLHRIPLDQEWNYPESKECFFTLGLRLFDHGFSVDEIIEMFQELYNTCRKELG